MYKLFFNILFIALLLITLCLLGLKPKMHKTVFVYNSDYKVVDVKPDIVVEKNLPTKTNSQVVDKNIVKKEKIDISKSDNNVPKVEQKKVVKNEKLVVNTVNSTPKKFVSNSVKSTQTSVKSYEQKVKEEEISWNKWRADVQNQLMRDVQLPIIQQGTIFKFSFDVDKYGRISNVQTWSMTPVYTPYAIQYIAPVIRSYQGKPLIEFPKGSSRISTTVEGGWKISPNAKFANPNDYKDSEKIRK